MDIERAGVRQSTISIQGTLKVKGKGVHQFASGLSLNIMPNAIVEIGNNFSCAHNARFHIYKSLVIGDDNMWSFDNVIMDTDAHSIYDENGALITHDKGITFGDNVWLGCRCIVLKGSKIPSGSLVAAGSTVTKALDKDNAIYNGNKVIRENITWSRVHPKDD